MKILLIVGTANDIFVYNMAKWLKQSINNLTIDVFEFKPSAAQGYDNKYYDEIHSAKPHWYRRIRPIRRVRLFHDQAQELEQFLEGRHYDIIQCHWITSPIVLAKNLHDYCDKLCYMFWGGELETAEIKRSHQLYMETLSQSLDQVDYIINSENFCDKLKEIFPDKKLNYRVEYLGSASMEHLYNLIEQESKVQSKQLLNIDSNKKTILIGYSGKAIHNHIPIIEELTKHPELKSKIHILAPMTRGGSTHYVKKVTQALKASGFSYTQQHGVFLSDQEIARLRNATDIVLQMSDFDGYSRSLIECMSASAIMIYGDWLNYSEHLDKDQFTAYPVKDIPEGIDKMIEILDNYDHYLAIANKAANNGRKYLWSECIKGWADLYQSIIVSSTRCTSSEERL